MNKINISTSNSSIKPLYNATDSVLYLHYPCSVTYSCTSYYFYLNPGKYLFDLYGAGAGETSTGSTLKREDSGKDCVSNYNSSMFGGNAACKPGNSAGSGGFISGSLTLKKRTKFWANIGGTGQIGSTNNADKLKGGYNGGGSCNYYSGAPPTSGGGATDIRVEEDDLWHRIIVAGGGGGRDNAGAAAGATNDGSGGAGGYPRGQSFWINGVYQDKMYATQTYGFSFGQGESAAAWLSPHENSTATSSSSDEPGAGGGWFGGHSSKNANGGAGGGSSFILTKTAVIPQGYIPAHDERYRYIENHTYAFTNNSPYAMKLEAYANGIRSGNGSIRITLLISSNLYGMMFANSCRNLHGFNKLVCFLVLLYRS